MNNCEVYAFKLQEKTCNNGSLKCGVFKLKLFIDETEWMNISDMKLMNDGNYYILPPAMLKSGKFVEFIEMSESLYCDIVKTASKMYETQKSALQKCTS